MSAERGSVELIRQLRMTPSEIAVATRAAELIRLYRLRGRGAWSGPTADQLVRDEVEDPSRQVPVLSLACAVEREGRTGPTP